MAVVQVASLGRARDPILGACMRNIFLFTAIRDIELQVKHVQGTKNGVADALSRIYSDKGKNQELFQMLKDSYTSENTHHSLYDLFYLISGSPHPYSTLVASARERIITAHRSSTVVSQKMHFKTYLSFVVVVFIAFLKNCAQTYLVFLHQNKLSPIICNYVASLDPLCSLYQFPCGCHNPSIGRFLRSISITSQFKRTASAIFDVPTLYHISTACVLLEDPILLWPIFLTAFTAS